MKKKGSPLGAGKLGRCFKLERHAQGLEESKGDENSSLMDVFWAHRPMIEDLVQIHFGEYVHPSPVCAGPDTCQG